MTRFQALFIKYLRVRQEGSWSWCRWMYYRRYGLNQPFDDMCIGNFNMSIKNFPHGMDLCSQAMDVLGENVEDGWN